MENHHHIENTADQDKEAQKKSAVEQKIKRRNFISFSTFFVLGGAAFGGWKWLYHSPEETAGITAGARKPLRRALNKTELFFRKFYSNNHEVKTYPKSMAAKKVRVNSDIGIDDEGFNPENWKLSVVKSKNDVLKVTMAEIKALPKTEIVFDFKCVEGWDQIQHWGGLKFADFIEHFKLNEQAKMPYIGMETPNGEYYIGLENESALHPQTLLAYEMNGQPIALEHGAPLRLIIPVKYGIKNLKRIGTINFSNNRPKDYWAEQGYDYYSGL
ncbi:molybdopterin-dependent oxidoreductase [Mucilaginibacter sp.]|uniref:molybdopterin-dependent oxidoreductase n=1 Tax=Mucilaginibacter sp. TaxID=1882438 RepID=UPI003AFF6F0A